MTSMINSLGAACAGALLLACAGTGTSPGPAAVAGAPLPASAVADGYYARGRDDYAARRLDAALGAYRAALQIDPGHVNAGNGLAVLYAGQGDYGRAIALWQSLIDGARVPGPEAAFLLRNLGHAYLLSGHDGAALAALEKACLLDPLNAPAWRQLGALLEKMGQGERAALMVKQAQSLEEHDLKADYTLARDSGAIPAGGPTLAAALLSGVPPASGAAAAGAQPAAMARTEITPAGAGVVQLRRVAAAGATGTVGAVGVAARMPAETPAPAAAPAAAPVAVPSATLRLEILNGNGVAGMAATLARTLGGSPLQVVRLANEGNFQVALTRIEYQPEQEAAARALAARLGVAVVVGVQTDAHAADVRIVLGRDLTDPAILRRRYLKQLKVAQGAPARVG